MSKVKCPYCGTSQENMLGYILSQRRNENHIFYRCDKGGCNELIDFEIIAHKTDGHAKSYESLQAEIAELKAGREGMVLVPKAPTETMLLAGANCQRSLDVIASKKLRANNIYLHMLKAHNGGEG